MSKKKQAKQEKRTARELALVSPGCLEKLRGPSVKFYRDNKPLLVASDFEHVGGGVAND